MKRERGESTETNTVDANHLNAILHAGEGAVEGAGEGAVAAFLSTACMKKSV